MFIVGTDVEDAESLRRRLNSDSRLEVVGVALIVQPSQDTPRLPPAIDAVVMTPDAWRRTSPAVPAAPSEAALVEHLTAREQDVLTLAADGLSNREIARALDISEHTVKFHLASIFGKLGASSRTDAVRLGFQLGLLQI